MKSYSRTAILFFAFWLFLYPPAQAGQDMTIAFPNFFPFFEQTRDGSIRGFFYDILKDALDKRMGVNTSWVEMPWQRCQGYVKSGKFDAMVTVPTQERSLYTETHPTPFYIKELKPFTYKGHPRFDEINSIHTIDDILARGFTVITYRGNGWHRNHVSGIGISTIETWPINNIWLMLAAKRGDLVIEWPMGAWIGMGEAGVAHEIREVDVSLAAMYFHLLIGKQSHFVDILPQFNQTIQQMQADGSLKKIISLYH